MRFDPKIFGVRPPWLLTREQWERKFGEAQYVRPSDLWAFREFTRGQTPAEQANIDKLVAVIPRRGWRTALILDYSRKTCRAKLGEGNHRLQAALKLRIKLIPVRVVKRDGAHHRHSSPRARPPRRTRKCVDGHPYTLKALGFDAFTPQEIVMGAANHGLVDASILRTWQT